MKMSCLDAIALFDPGFICQIQPLFITFLYVTRSIRLENEYLFTSSFNPDKLRYTFEFIIDH